MTKNKLLSVFLHTILLIGAWGGVVNIQNGYAQEHKTQQQNPSVGSNDIEIEQCLLDKLKAANGRTLVSKIRQECVFQVHNNLDQQGVLAKRILGEHATKFDQFVITPHRRNYVLPVLFTDRSNRDVYLALDPAWSKNIEDIEAKYQLSIKVPLNYDSIFTQYDSLNFAITLQSWWQVYSSEISKPFRETNYQPEIFYFAPLQWKPFGANLAYTIGIEHQSNGRSTAISRSWNRVYASLIWNVGNWAFQFKPWYRLEESKKSKPTDADGDDNPDINDYMGYFQLGGAYKYDTLEVSFTLRENFATHKGALELGLTFPMWGKLRGYAQLFTGYGESLIDYDHKQNRFGIGITLTDIL
ncbi:phospholipase A [Thalassotalea aquiviva]|uniref:phospholipase A n=1 Tax=Thalassotalea aquiviva TaxID=3242415 RepID=UPI00352B864F